jgi:hypothetical protein
MNNALASAIRIRQPPEKLFDGLSCHSCTIVCTCEHVCMHVCIECQGLYLAIPVQQDSHSCKPRPNKIVLIHTHKHTYTHTHERHKNYIPAESQDQTKSFELLLLPMQHLWSLVRYRLVAVARPLLHRSPLPLCMYVCVLCMYVCVICLSVNFLELPGFCCITVCVRVCVICMYVSSV